jgi:hypothetical protein
LINNNNLSERIVWDESLDNLLVENVNIYHSQKEKKLIYWKIIQQEVKQFNTFSSEALRKRYKTINSLK